MLVLDNALLDREISRSEGKQLAATAEAGAYDLLTALGIVYLGWMWTEIAAAVAPGRPCTQAGDAERLRKFQLARVWMQRQMPLVDGLCARIESGQDSLLALADDAI